ncbi:unnamed protein product [Psylliodes chrysocephalus]|uniref:acid phosphatase n=1 Tax=Psylliodes chrysocephalus TaxID=3402493 RepID=A0A9P0CSS1_9CUCU|nr:unnamed protein product [Psylliodes chrysocephala]
MSAASNLAGLYYPTNESTIWKKNLPWDPIPIHTIPYKDIAVIYPENICPKFEELYNSTLYSSYFKNVLQKHEAITTFIEKKTGWNIEELGYFETLYTVFYIYNMHNSSYLPEWADQIDMSELNYLAGLHFSIGTFTTEMQRLKIGPFFNNLHNYFDGIINGTNPKFLMISAHDETIASVLNSYGVYDYHLPEFAETIIWELYKSANDDVYLRIYNKKCKDFKELDVKQCQHQCSYDKYLEMMQSISVDSNQWKTECKGSV